MSTIIRDMSSDDLYDLKQFIEATVSQQLTLQISEFELGIESSIKKHLVASEKRLGAKIDDLSTAVAEALDTSNGENQKQLDNHEQRITKLEHQLMS